MRFFKRQGVSRTLKTTARLRYPGSRSAPAAPKSANFEMLVSCTVQNKPVGTKTHKARNSNILSQSLYHYYVTRLRSLVYCSYTEI